MPDTSRRDTRLWTAFPALRLFTRKTRQHGHNLCMAAKLIGLVLCILTSAQIVAGSTANAQSSSLKIGGIFKQPAPESSAKVVSLVPDASFFASDGTIATMSRNGFTLVDVDIDTSTRQRSYSAVFQSDVAPTQYWELPPDKFADKVRTLEDQGQRLISLHTYVGTDGTLLYSGVFQAGPEAQRYPGDMSWDDFTHQIDKWAPEGYFLTNLAVFVKDGQERYLGVWRQRPGGANRAAFWVSGWNSFAKQIQWEEALGLHLTSMTHWQLGNQRKYGGVWLEASGREDVVAATDAEVFTRKTGELAAASPGMMPVRVSIDHDYQPPVGLAAAFADQLDPVAVGYSYAISEAGTLTAKGGIGYARAPWEPSGNYPGSPMSSTTRMDIASVTKAVAATAIFKLLEGSDKTCRSGRCNASNFALDTPITSILTGYRFGQYVDRVTVKMLVDMSSDLYESSCDGAHFKDLNGYAACVLASCTKGWPQPASGGCAPPSGQYHYNGADPTILRMIIEKLTGMTFEQYVHKALFVPSGVDNVSFGAASLANANCNPALASARTQPLYYRSGASKTKGFGIVEANDRARSLKVCGAGAMQASAAQLDVFTRAMMTGVQGMPPLLNAEDRTTMLSAGMFGGPATYPGLGRLFVKNGGFNMRDDKGMIAGIVLAPDINTQLSGIVNTQGKEPSTQLAPEMPAALMDGLVRMHSMPLGVVSIKSRNNSRSGDMCLNVSGGALADSNADGSSVKIIQWTCGAPIDSNMLFVQLGIGDGDFLLRAAHSGHCLNVSGASRSDGAGIIQWTCDGAANEQFSFTPTTDGYGRIVNKNSGKCLDVSGGNASSGAAIVQNTCSSSPTQEFKLDTFADGNQ